MNTIYFGGGCFWCMEAVFQRVDGVESVVSGFAGGGNGPIDYASLLSGGNKHAEVVELKYNDTIELEELMNIFWQVHDPTSLNKQGADIGTQYRSSIYYTTEEQKNIIDQFISDQDDGVVTEIMMIDKFTAADQSHQNYFNKNKFLNPYCAVVISPKLRKLKKIQQSKNK